MPTGFRRSKLRYTGRAFREDTDQAVRGDILGGRTSGHERGTRVRGNRSGACSSDRSIE